MKKRKATMPKMETIARVLFNMPMNYAIEFINTFQRKHNPVESKSLVNAIFNEYHKTVVA